MSTLLVRTVLIYFLVFGTVRLMGKRQISDMQPFDLVITLLIADLASAPISDSGTPVLYGIIPILGLFILHKLVSFLSMRSQRIRSFVCGHPLIMISRGLVVEEALRASKCTLNDLMEQLRSKDVFSISEVEYAILETNGSLSVLKKEGGKSPKQPSVLLISDGVPDIKALINNGYDERRILSKLNARGVRSIESCLFASIEDDLLHVQTKAKSEKQTKKLYIDLKERA